MKTAANPVCRAFPARTRRLNFLTRSTPVFSEVDQFLCKTLRGEQPYWPATSDEDFAQSFMQRARHHGVEALVFEQARNTPQWDSWPEQVREQLTHAMRTGVAFDLLRGYEVANLLVELTRRGIAFLVTKGEALARTHYASPALRSRCDTDLFIDLNDINRVQTALLESGYKVVPPIYKSHQFMGVKQHRTGTPVVFDIHWRILNAPQFARAIDFAEALEHSIPLPGMDGCRTLGSVDSLLLACMHRKGSVLHDEDRLIWLYDIHLLVSALTPEQLQAFVQKAAGKNAQAACLDGLQRAQTCFHTKIPAAALENLATTEPEVTLCRRFHASNLSLLLDDLRCLPGMRSRLGLLGELFFPPPQSLMRKYGRKNPFWLPLLYLRHILSGSSTRLSLR